MFFGKKNITCENCQSKISEDYSYCPYCGNGMLDSEKVAKEFGMLGKNDAIDEDFIKRNMASKNLTLTDKMISAMVAGLIKNIDQQLKDQNIDPKNASRGIKIQIGVPGTEMQEQKKTQKHDFSINKISENQLQKLKSLPKTAAKTQVKRIGDKLIYELDTPGLDSIKDVFVSRLETGYEIRAIGQKKVYVNSLPVTMLIKSFSLGNNKLSIEFTSQNPA